MKGYVGLKMYAGEHCYVMISCDGKENALRDDEEGLLKYLLVFQCFITVKVSFFQFSSLHDFPLF